MSNTDIEIVVDDPTAPEADSPAVTSTGVVDVVVSLLLFALAVTLGWDNWRNGAAWDSTGPQPGYFPFYLSVILGGASLYGLAAAFLSRQEASETFVTQAQLRRVMAVFVPTLLFCLATHYLGLYVASFLLIASFMRMVGKNRGRSKRPSAASTCPVIASEAKQSMQMQMKCGLLRRFAPRNDEIIGIS